MDLTTQPNPHQATIDAISAISKDKGNDFTVVIKRRRNQGDLPQPVATLGEARLEHFIVGPRTPELWLPKLAGGGMNYQLTVFHSSDGRTPVGGPLLISVPGPSRDADPSAVEDPEWNGPGVCIVPEKQKAKTNDDQPLHSAPPAGSQRPPRSTDGVPVGDASNNANGHYATSALHVAEMSKQWDEVSRAREALAEERRRIEVAGIKRDADAQIAAAKAEADRARSESRERQDRIERELAEIRSRPVPVAADAKPDRFAEVLLEMKKADQEQRQREREFQAEQRNAERAFALERERIQAEAKASADRTHAEMTTANNSMQAKLLEMATTKPSGSDMAEKVLLSVTGAISNLMSNQVNMINSMSELGFGGRDDEPEEKEPAWVKSVERVARLFAPKPVPAPQLEEEPQQQVQEQQVQELPPASQQQQPPQQPVSVVEQIQRAIWSKRNAPNLVADFILSKVTSGDEGLTELLVSEAKISDVLTKLLSKEWLSKPENSSYTKSVASQFMDKGVKSGLFTEEALTEAMEDLQSLGK